LKSSLGVLQGYVALSESMITIELIPKLKIGSHNLKLQMTNKVSDDENVYKTFINVIIKFVLDKLVI
jgi:hypothetical protein